MTFGLHGRILLVDVGVKQYEIRPTSECPGNLGGKALATALLLEHCPAGADPLGPDNPVVIATGPICGSLAWGGSRYCICTKSPQTGLYAESYSGGAVPEAVEAAGFDAVVLTGASSGLTTLAVHEEGCEFLDASGMQGMETFVAEEEISRLTASFYPQGSRTGAMVVGPAAENLVRFAIVANDRWRCAGRCGVGTVLGAKKIKGLVFGGKRKRPLAEPDGLKAYAKDFLTRFKDSPGAKAYRARGTTQMVAIMNTARAFPAKYWSQGTCEHWERISGDTLHAEHEVVPHACRKCFMACGRKTTLRAGSYAGLTLEGPEYETIFAFGGLCMIESMEEIVRLNDLCDRLGLDTISAGNLCALAMEARELGRLPSGPIYGDASAVAELISDMAFGRGLGAVLAQGIVPAAEDLGIEDRAVHVNGLEPPGYEPRVLKGMGLSYAVSPRGACHLRTTFYKPELSGMIPPGTVEGKAELLIDFEDRLTIFDTMILCRFYRDMYDWDELGRLVELTCGRGLDRDGLRWVAAEITDMTRRFNLREGLVPEHNDRLPKRLLQESLPDGHRLEPGEMERMLADYYRLRDWGADGRPAE